MAEKNFFDLLKEKMAALSPSERHRTDDWATLHDRLNVALPEQPRRRHRALVLPLLLLTALLSSNAVWWQAHRRDGLVLHHLEMQVAGLQTSVKTLEAGVATVRTDTVWRTVYVRSTTLMLSGLQPSAARQGQAPSLQQEQFSAIHNPYRDAQTPGSGLALPPSKTGLYSGKTAAENSDNQPISPASSPDSVAQMAALPSLETPPWILLELPAHNIHPSGEGITMPANEEEPARPFGKTLLDALRPKYFKAGASIGWLYARSSGLMHEGGLSYGIEGVVGLSRHWSLTATFSAGQVHYKAHDPAAILGSPVLPPPGYGHHFAEMDVSGQKIRQFSLGLRYTFAQPGKPRPYLGLGWGGLTILPYTVEYEIQHEPSGTIQKGTLSISEKTRFRNTMRLSVGLEIPLSSRFDLTLEGSYLRQWKKPDDIAPDLTGIRGGVNWLF